MKLKRFSLILLAMIINACQSAPNVDPDSVMLPSISHYRCDTNDPMIVRNNGSSVTIMKPSGEAIELPAVEPGSTSRFGAGIVAVVFDGRSALYMETGKAPLECSR